MSKNPERLAWIILLTAFAVFCALVVGIPLSIRWYLINATIAHPTALTAIGGTVLVEKPGTGTSIGIREAMDEVPEGSSTKTDAASQAFLTLFEDSTVTLYNETQVVLLRMRSPRFGLSPKPDSIVLLVKGGRVRIGVAPAINSPLDFRVQTPHAEVKLKEGGYSLEVTNERSQVVVRRGQAAVTANDETVTLEQGERATAEIDGAPMGPLPSAQNLIENGDFSEKLLPTWIPYNTQVDPDEASGTAEIVSDGDRRAVRFSRGGGAKNHCETGIRQRIDKDVRDFTSLRLHLSLKLVYQSLPGGGYLSSEFPIIVRLDYEDPYGNDQFWTHGFYYKDPIEDWLILNGEKIPSYIWYPYESVNLMESEATPVYITSLTIYASGWEYESLVSNVDLLAEE